MRSLACRVCGSKETIALPVGKYADFFRLRVDTGKDEYLLFSRTRSVAAMRMMLTSRILRKIGRIFCPLDRRPAKQFRTHMQACAVCHGITPCHEYTFEDLLGIYHDYRSETYNRDRISVEPGYAKWVKEVGASSIEIKNRNMAADDFLRRNRGHLPGGKMIDFGGGDGRFVPPIVYEQFDRIDIYDASNAPLHASVDGGKVSKIAEPHPETYSFMTCMQVLEHVGNPRQFVTDALRVLRVGGLMYLEVPLESNDPVRTAFEQRIIDTPITIHEHMNLFDRVSLRSLINSIGALELVDDSEDVVDLGWCKGLNGRFLARKIK